MIVRSASSSGVNAVLRVSLLRRLTQYLQSYMQQFVISTFSREIQRPSAEKEWQHPATEEDVLPMYPCLDVRFPPLEVQAASYFAASVRIDSFSSTSIMKKLNVRMRGGEGGEWGVQWPQGYERPV